MDTARGLVQAQLRDLAGRAEQAAQQRISDLTNARRKEKETALEFRTRLQNLGMRQVPAVLPTEQSWKERYIAGSNYGAVDPYADLRWRLNCDVGAVPAELYNKTAEQLTTVLNLLIMQTKGSSASSPSSSKLASKPDATATTSLVRTSRRKAAMAKAAATGKAAPTAKVAKVATRSASLGDQGDGQQGD